MAEVKLLCIVVTYNAMQWAERCFASIKNSTVCPDIFVVDNGSTDGTQAFIKGHYPEVMFHQSEENLGFGKANNLGLQYALDHNYDYVYLLNQDAWIFPDTFMRLIELSKDNPEYGILSPFQMNEDLKTIDCNFSLNACSWSSNKQLLNDFYNQNVSEIYAVKSVMAAHWFMPLSTVKCVGGFSPSFPHYGEDDNYIKRVLIRGLKIGIVPSLRVVHDRGGRVDTSHKKMYLGYIGSILFLSDPALGLVDALGLTLYTMLSNIVKYKSMMPLLYFFKLLWGLKKIVSNKRVGELKKCAFLNLKKIDNNE